MPLNIEVDRIYNLGCPASPVHYQFDPVQTTKTSVHGATNMLGLAQSLQGSSAVTAANMRIMKTRRAPGITPVPTASSR